MAAHAKRKPVVDTETLLAEAHAGLADIDSKITEHDRQRLEIDPAIAVKTDLELAAARQDAARRIELLEQRAADELRQRQVKAQAALIGRIETTLAKRDQHISKMCEHMANAVSEMKLVQAANNAAAAAWPWNGVRDNEPCLFGLFFRSAIRHELWRLSGDPFHPGLDFPGSENPTPFRNLDPKSVPPLTEKAAIASGYASRIMREAPIRPLPPPSPPPAPIEVQPSEPPKSGNGSAAAVVETQATPSGVNHSANPEYVYKVDFIHAQTRERRTEEVQFGPAEIGEASLDGLGATGPRGKEIALRLATERVPSEFVFAGQSDSIRFDMNRLVESINRD